MDFGAFAAVTLAASLAMERFVVAAKTAFPWLAQPKQTLPGQSEMAVDRKRRRSVLGITIVACMVTSLTLAEGEHWYSMMVDAGGTQLHWAVFALMISGGSAFWASVVGFASAAKDIRSQEKLAIENAARLPQSVSGAAAGPRVVQTL
jgi:hypothetical protein